MTNQLFRLPKTIEKIVRVPGGAHGSEERAFGGGKYSRPQGLHVCTFFLDVPRSLQDRHTLEDEKILVMKSSRKRKDGGSGGRGRVTVPACAWTAGDPKFLKKFGFLDNSNTSPHVEGEDEVDDGKGLAVVDGNEGGIRIALATVGVHKWFRTGGFSRSGDPSMLHPRSFSASPRPETSSAWSCFHASFMSEDNLQPWIREI